jgi:hypothetical protein
MGGLGCSFGGTASHSVDRVPTDVDVHEASLGRPHIPEQALLQVPGSVRAPEPRSIKKVMERRERRTSSGCDPALSHIWFGSPITVASWLVAS